LVGHDVTVVAVVGLHGVLGDIHTEGLAWRHTLPCGGELGRRGARLWQLFEFGGQRPVRIWLHYEPRGSEGGRSRLGRSGGPAGPPEPHHRHCAEQTLTQQRS
jgi:hypothetical protein